MYTIIFIIIFILNFSYILNHSSIVKILKLKDKIISQPIYLNLIAQSFKQARYKCFKDIGCFANEGPFYNPLIRPIIFDVQSREHINTKFELFTNKNKHFGHVLRQKNEFDILNSYFDPIKPTKILIHGFIEYWLAKPEYYKRIKDELLKEKQYNIITVNWKGGNFFPYSRAVVNARVAGAEVALMIKTLMKVTGASAKDFHLIGHSLGAHVAGYAGERIAGLGRITGLDPAQPYFQGMPKEVTLDSTDAEFVDIIHSDIRPFYTKFGLGTKDPLGHIDFYPNGGLDNPGCRSISKELSSLMYGFKYSKYTNNEYFWLNVQKGLRLFLACSHMKSVDYFISSINNKNCSMVGYLCNSWKEFKMGLCDSCNGEKYCPIMGFWANKIHNKEKTNKINKYFLFTDSKNCLIYYRIKIKLALNNQNVSFVRGKLKITAVDSRKSRFLTIVKDKQDKNYHGSKIILLQETTFDINQIDKILIYWRPMYKSNGKGKIHVNWIDIKPMHNPSQKIFYKFCDNKALLPFEITTFRKHCE